MKKRWTTLELDDMIIDSYLNCDDQVARENPLFQTWVKEVRQPAMMLEYLGRSDADVNLLTTLKGLKDEFE